MKVYLRDSHLFVLYLAHRNTLAVDHRERGQHYDTSLGAAENNLPVAGWEADWERFRLPARPTTLDLAMRVVPPYKAILTRTHVGPGSTLPVFRYVRLR